MIELVISGGQTGVDQAAWRAAKSLGIATGGWMPKGFLTERGRRPEFAEQYGAREHESRSYPERTKSNVLAADATLWVQDWFGDDDSPGFYCTKNACHRNGKPFYVAITMDTHKDIFAREAVRTGIKILNVAGSRESRIPGIGKAAKEWLTDVFKEINGL